MRDDRSRIVLPPIPPELGGAGVAAWSEPVQIDTYEAAEPDLFPHFLDSRVYQGSSGRVFPLPFTERIAHEKVPRLWEAVHLENEWMRVMILPELGGRIHIAFAKTAGYDLFYRNNVIKPALVGLAGPWISGGVEFNWPQHHRPATYLPVDVEIEHADDGSATVWCSDHDPFERMKGMHGIRLRPDSAAIEAVVRLFNRTDRTQTFLWWANAAVRVGGRYQSFFPTDVDWVADHAKRDVVTYPRVSGHYYGIDYPAQVDADHPQGDRIDWSSNIPVPTSYMITATDAGFFGGYDHDVDAGFVHWADPAISPGKKQWTWGNAAFGHAWDRNLTDDDGPYIELMAGVYTDNQPDFSFLAPGETKSFSQYWYPITRIGPVHEATDKAALRIDVEAGVVRIGVVAAAAARGRLEIRRGGQVLTMIPLDLVPGEGEVVEWALPPGADDAALEVVLLRAESVLVRGPVVRATARRAEPTRAVAPPEPAEVATVEELDLIATYLEQYRHATRSPEPYWHEALARDPGDIRAHLGLGMRRYRSAHYSEAERHFSAAVTRQTAWAPNPPDGEAFYDLGLALARQGSPKARAAFAKAAWSAAWVGAASLAVARLDAADDPASALELLRRALTVNVEQTQVRNLLVVVLRRLGRSAEARELLGQTLQLDPLDQWARDLADLPLTSDATMLVDVAKEYSSVGAFDDALRLLDEAERRLERQPRGQVNVGPMIAIHRAVLLLRTGADIGEALQILDAVDPGRALPTGLDDIDALQQVLGAHPDLPVAWSMLGSWFYDRGRNEDAMHAWRRGLEAGAVATTAAVLHRNLGVAAYNVVRDARAAVDHYERAVALLPDNARLLYEADQLAGRIGVSPADRLARLDSHALLVDQRDDLSVVRAMLLTDAGRIDEARALLVKREFQPWEGGEGAVLQAWDGAALASAAGALVRGEAEEAVRIISEALNPPASLGEARHPLATTADLHLALGDAFASAGRASDAAAAWDIAARAAQDFSDMAVAPFTERSAWSIVALARLGRRTESERRLREFADYIERVAASNAAVDYFATSLPSMLLFRDTPEVERDRRAAALRAVYQLVEHSLATAPERLDLLVDAEREH